MADDEDIQASIKALRAEVASLRNDVKGLVEAWRAASFLTGFVKWAAAVVGAIAVLGYALTHPKYWIGG